MAGISRLWKYPLMISAATAYLLSANVAAAFEKGNFDNLAPKQQSSEVYSIGDTLYKYRKSSNPIDWDHKGGKETVMEFYYADDGSSLCKLVAKGRIWAWGIYHDGKGYTIMKNDGRDFNRKYGCMEGLDFPDFLK